MDNIEKILSGNIRRLRRSSGLTIEFLAEAVGVVPTTVQGWETGRVWPTPGSIRSLAKALKVSESDLYRSSGAPDPPADLQGSLEAVVSALGYQLAKPTRLRRRAINEVQNRLAKFDEAQIKLLLTAMDAIEKGKGL